MQEGKEKQGQQ